MNKVLFCLISVLGFAAIASARPEPPRHARPHQPPKVHHPAPRPKHHSDRWGWGLNIAPWGSSFTVGTRIGRHGGVSVSLPLVERPVVREEKTTIVVQQPVIVQSDSSQKDGVELNPLYADSASSATARTWVEGYWKVTRTPEGKETSRVWVPGHWE